MIIGLYLISPLLRLITSNKKATRYFLILSFIFAFLIPEVISLIDIVCPPIAETIKYLNGFMNVSFVLGYSGYYVLGYYLHKTKIDKKTEYILYILGILGLIATALLSALASIYKNLPIASFYEYISVNVLFTSIAVFVFGKNHLNKKLDDKKTKRLVFFSKSILGIYLIHLLVLFLLDTVFNFNTLSFNPILSVPIIWFLVFATSTLLSIILNKIPFINKWIV
jgi:surface polysaccharide O-acyltransferase-like enzyme